jgi:hypothetical protein
MEMTNAVPVATPAVSAAQDMPFVHFEMIEPIPWGGFLLLALWVTAVIVILAGIIRGRARRRRGESTESLSIGSLLISICVFFLGSGVVLWSSASALESLAVCGSAPTKLVMQFTVLRISSTMRLLAINSMVAGVGFFAAIWMRGRAYGEAREGAAGTARVPAGKQR